MIDNSWLQPRIKRLEEQEARNNSVIQEFASDHFRVAVSCPPDLRLHVRGGNLWAGSYWVMVGQGSYLADMVCDFTDSDDVNGLPFTFDNPYYYFGATLTIYTQEAMWDSQPTFGLFLNYAFPEQPTAADAEDKIISHGMLGAWKEEFPLCGVVLRNDGRIGEPNAFMPIDAVNRGRSYYWMDLRPRHYVEF